MKNLSWIFLFCALSMLPARSMAQATPSMYWDTVYAQPGTDVVSTLYFENVYDVGSISIIAYYKMSALQYVNTFNIFPQVISNHVLNIISPGIMPGYGGILLGYYSLTPLNFAGTNILLKAKFHYLQDSSKIGFDPSNGATQVSNSNGVLVPLVISPGYVLQCPVSAISSPSDTTVFFGDSVSFLATPSGPGPFSLQWQVSDDNGITWTNLNNVAPYSGVNTSQLQIDSAFLSLDQNLYRCIETGSCPISSAPARLTVHSPLIQGILSYNNGTSSPMAACNVFLKQGATIVRQTTTNALGEYTFQDFPLGSYTIEPQITKPWGGATSLDALMIMKYFAGLLNLSGMSLQAADVNGNTAVNTADAMLIAQRFVNLISTFPASDWITEMPAVNAIAPVTYNVNLKVICRGDVNGSYIP